VAIGFARATASPPRRFSAVFITSTVLSHGLREAVRTPSRLFAEYSVPGKIVAELMGQAKVETTLNIYTQVLDASLRTAVAKVGNELFTIVHRPAGTTG
jgi:integrase